MTVIINSGGANIASIKFALERIGIQANLTNHANEIKKARHVILPGVGTAAIAIKNLQELRLVETICALKQPVLGICLGMQLLYEYSEENDVNCLGIIQGKIKRIIPTPQLTVPHMGWNTLQIVNNSPLFIDIEKNSYVYFVHSYAAPVTTATIAVTTYNQEFAAAVQQDNFFATQFHPERSGVIGERILKNFLAL